jgi:hypothetical protein
LDSTAVPLLPYKQVGDTSAICVSAYEAAVSLCYFAAVLCLQLGRFRAFWLLLFTKVYSSSRSLSKALIDGFDPGMHERMPSLLMQRIGGF